MNIAIIGAGVAGLAAAYDLAHAGHRITVYEAAPVAGGLASGFRDARWQWPLERFYHHIFQTDAAIIGLANRIGFGDKLFFKRPVTAQWWRGQGYSIAGAREVLAFPGLSFPDRVRFGAVTAFLKYGPGDWHALERTTAVEWARRWYGPRVYEVIWRPLLEGKFGPYAGEANMAWLWARLKARSFQLGYFAGGFQGFADALLAAARARGINVRLAAPVDRLEPCDDGWKLIAGGGEACFDQVLVTGEPRMLSRLAPQLPSSYVGELANLRSIGAVVLTLALKQQLMPKVYWLQGMHKGEFPFLALVEHTNFIDPKHYGGDRLVYCGDYLPPEHEYFSLSKEQLLERFLPALAKVNPAFTPDWVRDTWLHRAPYAQPIVGPNHSRNIPPIPTPLPGLFWASMSQVYPWDRGTNFAVELGQRAASEMGNVSR